MKSNLFDSVIMTILILAMFYVTYEAGYAMSERKHCIASGGHFSLDYYECLKGDLNERVR